VEKEEEEEEDQGRLSAYKICFRFQLLVKPYLKENEKMRKEKDGGPIPGISLLLFPHLTACEVHPNKKQTPKERARVCVV